MNYREPRGSLEVHHPLSGVVMEPTDYSTNRCYYQNEKYGIWLYQGELAGSDGLNHLSLSFRPF